MDLGKKVKTALDETRILILGSQVLIGFQFRGVFHDAYEELPAHARYLDGLALVLMLAVTALLIAPSVHHRVVWGGEDSGRLHRLICWTTCLALLPFALSLGLDLFIAIERISGLWPGIVAGAGFGALALFAWYGFEFLRRASVGQRERAMSASQVDQVEKTPLHTKIEQMLTEARVILPGAQALFGFQLAIVITQAFERLSDTSQMIHAVSLGLIAITVILLMAPAAYHRIVYAGEDAAEFHRIGSIMVTAATVPLALGVSTETYVVIAKIAGSARTGMIVAVLVFAGFAALWYVYPALRRGAVWRRPGDPGARPSPAE